MKFDIKVKTYKSSQSFVSGLCKRILLWHWSEIKGWESVKLWENVKQNRLKVSVSAHSEKDAESPEHFHHFKQLFMDFYCSAVLPVRHRLFQSFVLSLDVRSVLSPVTHCKGVSMALPVCLSSSKKVAEGLFISHLSDSCTPNHSNGLSGSKSLLSLSHIGPDAVLSS